MKRITRSLMVAGTVLSAGACAEGTSGRGPGARLNIDVAPLTLPGVEEVTYGIKVLNGALQEVWSRTGMTSTQFGDGRSALSYVGPCDSQSNPYTVELTIEQVIAGGQPL